MPDESSNPRRAYGRDGFPMPPMDLGNMRALRVRSVIAMCEACDREAIVSAERWPADCPVPDVGMRLRCSLVIYLAVTVEIEFAERW